MVNHFGLRCPEISHDCSRAGKHEYSPTWLYFRGMKAANDDTLALGPTLGTVHPLSNFIKETPAGFPKVLRVTKDDIRSRIAISAWANAPCGTIPEMMISHDFSTALNDSEISEG